MKKVFLGVFAVSTMALSQINGDVEAKLTTTSESFSKGSFGIVLSGNAKFDNYLNIEGNIDLEHTYNKPNYINFSDDVKIYDSNEGVSHVLNVNNFGQLVLRDSYLKLGKNLSGYGMLELKQKALEATSLSYLAPIYKNNGLEFSTKIGYTLRYFDRIDNTVPVRHRGDIDANVSYEIIKGLKLISELGLAVSDSKRDVSETKLKVLSDKLAIIPKASLGVEYKDGKGLETNTKISYQKEGLGVDFKFSYDIESIDNIKLKPVIQISNSSKFLPKDDQKDVKKYFNNFTVISAGLDLNYRINDKLSFVSNAKIRSFISLEKMTQEKTDSDLDSVKQVIEDKFDKHIDLFNPTVSLGLKYIF